MHNDRTPFNTFRLLFSLYLNTFNELCKEKQSKTLFFLSLEKIDVSITSIVKIVSKDIVK